MSQATSVWLLLMSISPDYWKDWPQPCGPTAIKELSSGIWKKATLNTDASINVGVAVTELVTNAYKYAYPEGGGDIRVSLRRTPASRIEIVVEDDGVGRGSGVAKGTGLGTRIVASMATTLGTEVQYQDRRPGTAARLSIPVH